MEEVLEIEYKYAYTTFCFEQLWHRFLRQVKYSSYNYIVISVQLL